MIHRKECSVFAVYLCFIYCARSHYRHSGKLLRIAVISIPTVPAEIVYYVEYSMVIGCITQIKEFYYSYSVFTCQYYLLKYDRAFM
jgi:hypothetical protein